MRKLYATLIICLFTLSFFASSLTVNATETTPIKKYTHFYGAGWSDAEVLGLSAFDYVIADPQGRDGVGSEVVHYLAMLHGNNSNTKAYAYFPISQMHTSFSDWSTVNANPSWFMVDAGGDRLNDTCGYVWMQINSTGWLAHLQGQISNALSDGFDGVYFDVVLDQIEYTFNGTVTDLDYGSWHSGVVAALTYFKAQNGGTPIIINTNSGWEFGHINYDYVNVVDGSEIEGFMNGFHSYPDAGKADYALINYLYYASHNLGKNIFAGSICTTNNSQAAEFGYASFLVGMGGNQAWAWNVDAAVYTNTYRLLPIMSLNVLSATAPAYSSQNVYMRNFTNALAVTNTFSSSRSITLPGYHFLNGTSASSFTIPAYSGYILLHDGPAPTPTPTAHPILTPQPTPTAPGATPSPATIYTNQGLDFQLTNELFNYGLWAFVIIAFMISLMIIMGGKAAKK